MHPIGYLKHAIDVSVRKGMLDVVEQYRRGEVNWATPITLLHHHLKHDGSEYINRHSYFTPSPSSLDIRNTV